MTASTEFTEPNTAVEALQFLHQRRSIRAFTDQPVSQALLGQLLQAQERVLAAGRWPEQRRLLLCDDDFGTSGWSWVPHGVAAVQPLADDPLAYPRIIAGLSRLADH